MANHPRRWLARLGLVALVVLLVAIALAALWLAGAGLADWGPSSALMPQGALEGPGGRR